MVLIPNSEDKESAMTSLTLKEIKNHMKGVSLRYLNSLCVQITITAFQYRLVDLASRDVQSLVQHYKDLKIGSEQYSEFDYQPTVM